MGDASRSMHQYNDSIRHYEEAKELVEQGTVNTELLHHICHNLSNDYDEIEVG